MNFCKTKCSLAICEKNYNGIKFKIYGNKKNLMCTYFKILQDLATCFSIIKNSTAKNKKKTYCLARNEILMKSNSHEIELAV